MKPGLASLPISCPGCGAFTQWIDPEQAGYYTTTRRAVKVYIRDSSKDQKPTNTEIENEMNNAQAGHGNEPATASGSDQPKREESVEGTLQVNLVQSRLMC